MLACFAYEEVYGSAINLEIKIGQTVHLKLDKFIRDISMKLKYPENGTTFYKAIVKDGKITKYAVSYFIYILFV